ncbi:MAG: flavin reductase family protein [candidate division Zixibacteria bacterium]|nr:flavin reductase family protein [candidate division Zixibacteria bacterium]
MTSDKNLLAVLKRLEYGVYIVTMGKGEAGNAFTASWVTQVSSEPPMVAVAIHNKHQSARLLNEHESFLVNLLPAEGESVARTYYGPAESGYEKLKAASITTSPVTRAPIINGAAAYLECRIVQRVLAGNHTLYLGEVVGGASLTEGPLLTSSNCKLRYLG